VTAGHNTVSAPRPSAAGADIVLAGLGLRPSHITTETVQALHQVRRIYSISYVPGTDDLLRRFCPDVVDLRSMYESEADRLNTYKRQAAAVLDGGIEAGPVALVVYGHPLILAMPSMFVLRLAPTVGLTTKVLPAVSALDCLLADLGIDPTVTGLQSHEATDLLLYDRPLIPSCATVLWQVGSLETRLHVVDGLSRPERLFRLRDHLLRYFPPDHLVVSVSSAVTEDEPPQILRMPISELPDHSAQLHLGATLYIPPRHEKVEADPQLTEALSSRDHLATITTIPGATRRTARP
jgi:uncharacterized protein YabN with tetrapyrrole methylase and pyrophosphatase domain